MVCWSVEFVLLSLYCVTVVYKHEGCLQTQALFINKCFAGCWGGGARGLGMMRRHAGPGGPPLTTMYNRQPIHHPPETHAAICN